MTGVQTCALPIFAIALLIPLNVGIFVIALGTDTMGPAASILAFPLLAFLGQFAIYRARRYRLTRTIYRGIRCHQDGSAWLFAAQTLLWWVLIAITFGLAYPLAQASLERFKMRHTHYGDLRGRFEGSGLRLLLRGLPMWLLAIGPMLLMIVYAVIAVQWSEVGDAIGSSESGEQTFARIAKAVDRKSTRLNSSHIPLSRMPSSA